MSSKLQEAIDKLLKEQSKETNLVESLWLLYAVAVKIPTGGVQWIESRRAFFAGAATLFEAIMRVLEPGNEATDNDVHYMDRIAAELCRFQEDIAKGTA